MLTCKLTVEIRNKKLAECRVVEPVFKSRPREFAAYTFVINNLPQQRWDGLTTVINLLCERRFRAILDRPRQACHILMAKTYTVWVGRQVVLQVDSGESRVPLRGRVVNESNDAIRFRLEGRWDVDIFKEMIVRVEADHCPVPTMIAQRPSNKVLYQPHYGAMLMQQWSCAWELWWSHHFSKTWWYKTTSWTGLAGTILFLLALQVGVLEPLGFYIRVVCGFLGLLLSAVSLGSLTWLLGDSTTMKTHIIPRSSKLFSSFFRCIRHPQIEIDLRYRKPG
ncbi:MAG: hypothetical protein WBL50_19785 [Candidatus Acidiferrum sp.]